MGNQYKEWTKEEIIDGINNYCYKNNKTPRTNEFRKINGLPSYTYALKIFNTNNIYDIFNECGINRTDTITPNKISEEYGLLKLKEFYIELNRIPTCSDFKAFKKHPSIDWYTEKYGCLSNALYAANIINALPNDYDEKLINSINTLKNLAEKLNRCPMVLEYENAFVKDFNLDRRSFERTTSLKYNDICKLYISNYNMNRDIDITYEDLKCRVDECFNSIGHVPNIKEYGDYCREFYNGIGSSVQTIEVITGLKYLEFLKSMGYTSSNTTTIPYDKDKCLMLFKNLCIKLNRIPIFDEINKDINMPSSGTYLRYFGSIENIIKLTNTENKCIYRRGGYGKISLNIKGEICLSVKESIITNYFIEKNISYEKETSYSEFFKRDTRRFDWKICINGKYFYCEYFGMYFDTWKHDKSTKYKERTDKKYPT